MSISNRQKVLMACPNYWDSPFQVGSHHLGRAFADSGREIAYVSDPVSPLHLLKWSSELRERLACYLRGGVRRLDGKVWAYVPGALLTPHNRHGLRAEWMYRHWPALSWPDVRRTIRNHGFGTVDLLYFDSIAQRFWLDEVDS